MNLVVNLLVVCVIDLVVNLLIVCVRHITVENVVHPSLKHMLLYIDEMSVRTQPFRQRYFGTGCAIT